MGTQTGKGKITTRNYLEENMPKNVLWVRIKGAAIIIDKNYVNLIAQTLLDETKLVELADLA